MDEKRTQGELEEVEGAGEEQAQGESVLQPGPTPWGGGRPRKGLRKGKAQRKFTGEQRLLILDAWLRSGLPARDFAPLVGIAHHTLYAWKKVFAEEGPAGLMPRRRRARGESRLPEPTKRAIVMLKEAHPEYGCQYISDVLARSEGLGASPNAVARVLKEAGYELQEGPTKPHRSPTPQRFERDAANRLWQVDLFTFVLKRQNRRVHLVCYLDDHSRFITGYGLHGTASAAMVIEVLRSAVATYGPPEELLTDNGTQFVTWRGKSQFSRECERRGIKQIVSKPRRPQTLGKIERFWGTLWRGLVESAIFVDLEDARTRIGHFIDHYNFHRPHQGIKGLVPADRYFGAEGTVREMMQDRVAANAKELAVEGTPKPPFYVTGKVAEQSFSVHAEGERMILTRAGGQRQEIALTEPTLETDAPPVPGSSPLDESLGDLAIALGRAPATGDEEDDDEPA